MCFLRLSWHRLQSDLHLAKPELDLIVLVRLHVVDYGGGLDPAKHIAHSGSWSNCKPATRCHRALLCSLVMVHGPAVSLL
jgi:hypothetical protein